MRIDWLRIPKVRNLRNIEIDFDERTPMTVLLGLNGSGKSNLFEVIVEIFQALEQGESPSFAYTMKYFCHGRSIEIDADPAKSREPLAIQVDGDSVAANEFKRQADEYLPAYVFAYYSGWSDRLEELFRATTQRYYRANRSPEGSKSEGSDCGGSSTVVATMLSSCF